MQRAMAAAVQEASGAGDARGSRGAGERGLCPL
jgi:hypothetical protein